MTKALDIRQLEKSFDTVPAVKNLTLAIEAGEIFGLLGPNGAGKSTTINMVAGVTRIGSGQIRIFGHDPVRDYRITRRQVGVMHQELVIDSFFTIDRALKIHAGYYGVRSDPDWRAILIDRLGLGPHLHKPMHKLSGGLKRRFMVAKAMIHKPRLLILDEPTAGVDVELRRSLWDFVRDINRDGTTVLLTTHYLEEAEQMCGRIAIMHQGELIALETTPKLLARLGGRTLNLKLSRPVTEIPPALAPYACHSSAAGRILKLTLPPGEPAAVLLQVLASLNLPVAEIESEKTGLEEVFLQLTGRDRRLPKEI